MKLPMAGIFAIAALVALVTVCGCTSTDDGAQPPGVQPEGTGAPQMNTSFQPNGTFPEQRGQPQMNLTSAAAALGVTEEELRTALGEPGEGQTTFAVAAAKLGVSEEELIEALGIPEERADGGIPGDREGDASSEPR